MIKYLLGLSLPLLILDQLTKWWILKRFPNEPPPHEYLEVIPNFFNLTRVHNRGMAFGLMNDHPFANYIFIAVGVAALFVIFHLWKKNSFPDVSSKVAVALLIAGIFGNQTDRIIPGRGYVVDFLDFKLPFWHLVDKDSGGHFPCFNVADSCISIAAILMIVYAIRGMKEESIAKKAAGK